VTAIRKAHVSNLSTLVSKCDKHSKKEESLAKLREGVKFDDVAREFSEDKARQGGSLGWKTRGSLHGDFEKVAYELEPSTTGNPKCKPFLVSFFIKRPYRVPDYLPVH